MTDRWSPLVLGRLLYADDWWRAVPAGGLPKFAERAAEETHNDGYDLAVRPRFLLAQDHRVRIVAVACAAADLGDQFLTDEAGRPLYCLAGWAGPAGARVPSLAELRAGHVEWAAQLYHDHVKDDWTLPKGGKRRHDTDPAAPPWTRPLPAPSDRSRPPDPGRWPAGDETELWDRAARSRVPLVLSVGWLRAPTTDDVFSHVAGDDVRAHRPWPSPPPQPKEVVPVHPNPVARPGLLRMVWNFIVGDEPPPAPKPRPARPSREAIEAARQKLGSQDAMRRKKQE